MTDILSIETPHYTLEKGDCLTLLKDIPDNSIDMILADPPYNITSTNWDKDLDIPALFQEYIRIIKPNHVIAVFGNEPFSSKLRVHAGKYYKYDWIWLKKSTTGFPNAKKRPLKRFENIMIFSKGDKTSNQPVYYPIMVQRGNPLNKSHKHQSRSMQEDIFRIRGSSISYNNIYYPTNVLEFKKDKRGIDTHPTAKPVALLEYLIKTYTLENEVVLDSCMGSGSTGIAALKTNRDFIGMELDQKWFDCSANRLEKTYEILKIVCKNRSF